jgi:hypothetical protein
VNSGQEIVHTTRPPCAVPSSLVRMNESCDSDKKV